MDGTPFLKQYKLREDLPSQCPKVDVGAPSHVAGLPPTAGRIPQYQVFFLSHWCVAGVTGVQRVI
jgi:hypothetical protein